MRILITGVSGFLGRHLVSALGAAGHEVSGLGLGDDEVAGIEYRAVDILDTQALGAAVDEIAPEAIVHLAGASHVGQSWEQMPSYFAANVLGAENVLSAAGRSKVLLASSSEVYGNVPESEQPIVEDRVPAPQNPYALTKAAAERLTLAMGGIVVRIFNLIGPGQAPVFALPSFARQLAQQAGSADPSLRVGNLEARRDFVNVTDGAEALRVAIEKGSQGEIYNLGSGTSLSIREALDRLLRVSGVDAQVTVDPARLRPVDVPLLCADASKLRALGWEPDRGVDAALEELWRSVAGAEVDRSARVSLS